MLPEDPIAEYLEDSTYLITSRKDNEALVNYTEGSKQGASIPGCKSCLIRPECGGRIENPKGTMVLHPDARSCQYDTGFVMHVEPNWLIKTLL